MAIHPQLVDERFPGFIYGDAPRNVYWEMTRACDLECKHCRADAQHERDPHELNTEQGKALIRSVKEMGSMLILTGGDPMKRADLFELMEYARAEKVPLAITPSTTPTLTEPVMKRFSEIGVAAVGISLDAPTAPVHDGFRQVDGTFASSMRALDWAREYNLSVQVNTTVTTGTLPHLQSLYKLLSTTASPPVRRWSLFLLIPVGRGMDLDTPSPEQVEELFEWVYKDAAKAPFHVGTVEAPHYRRYWIEQKTAEGVSRDDIAKRAGMMGFGVRDGNGVIFVSHLGEVYPAGFLPYPLLGNVRDQSLREIYMNSPALLEMRDANKFTGRCGRCEYRWACGGSRARAYAMTGDVLGDDPLCGYQPGANDSK